MAAMTLSCGICISKTSPYGPPDGANDWAAVTDCGHIYHLSCLKTWWNQSDATGCPNKCVYRNVKGDRRRGDGRGLNLRFQEPIPYLKLFATGNNTLCDLSSDAVEPPESRSAGETTDHDDEGDEPVRGAPRKRLRTKDRKGKRRAVEPPAEAAVALAPGVSSVADADAGSSSSALEAMRRERNQALDTIRSQREAHARLLAKYEDALYARREIPCTRDERADDDYDDDLDEDDADRACACLDCRPTPKYRRIKEELWELRHKVAELETQSIPRRMLVAAQEELRSMKDRLAASEERRDGLQTHFEQMQAAAQDFHDQLHEAKVVWRHEERKLREQLSVSGSSGQEQIKELKNDLAGKDTALRMAKTRIDQLEREVEHKTRDAEGAVADARKAAKAEIAEANKRVEAAEEQLSQERTALKRYKTANAALDKQCHKLKVKVRDLKAKRGIVATESDAEESAAPSTSNRTFARTTSSRSQLSLSPPVSPGPAIRINNNSAILGNSPRKQKHARTAVDAWELSREEEPLDLHPTADAPAETTVAREFDFDDEDELEYADVASGVAVRPPGPATRPSATAFAAPAPLADGVIELSDSDSDGGPGVVSSSYFTKSAAAVKGKAPVRPASSGVRSSQPKTSTGSHGHLPFAPLPNAFSETSRTPTWNRPVVASSTKQDKWTPDLSKGLTGTGAKRRVKRK